MIQNDRFQKSIAGQRIGSVFVVLIVLLATLTLGVSPALATEVPRQQSTQIDSCTTITESGSYALTADLTNASATENTGIDTGNDTVHACIVVAASDVVLRGNDHEIVGKGFPDAGANVTVTVNDTDTFNETEFGQFPIGIAVRSPDGTPLTNVTVTNLTTADWFIGVLYDNVTNAALTDVTANDNANLGFELLGVHDSTFADNTANRNPFAGLYMATSTNNTIVRNSFSANGIVGIDLFYGNDNNTLGNNVVTGSEVGGIAIIQSAGNLLMGNTVRNTTGNESLFGFSGGIALVSAPDTRIVNTTARNNRQWTIYSTDCPTVNGTCRDVEGENRSGGTTLTVERLDFETTTVSFTGKNVAIATVDASRGSDALDRGLLVTNTTADAVLELQTEWKTTDDGATNETES